MQGQEEHTKQYPQGSVWEAQKDPSQEVEPPKRKFQKKVHLWMPFTKLLPVHLANLHLSQEDPASLGNLQAQMYVRDKAISYPFRLHISRVTSVKIIVDKVCPWLPIWDAAKKKGFKVYYTEEMLSRQMKVEVVNYPRNWSSLFSGKKLIHALDDYDAKTLWNQIVSTDTLKASTSGYDRSYNTKNYDFIEVLRPIRNYYFVDACVFFTKDANNYSFIQHLLQLPTIQSEGTYNLLKISEAQMIAHVT